MEIVEALDIEGVDEADLAKRREEVKTFIVASRAGYFSDTRLGRCCVGEFDVDTPDIDSGKVPPPNIPCRPLNPEQMAAAKKEFQKMVDNGILIPSSSPWGAPIVMVRKPGGRGWRLCLDFRAGNDVSVKQHYPLPKVQDTIDRIGQAKFYASLDCLKAFWQIPCSERTQQKTALNFPWGKFEMTCMPMGMQAASATFQRIMDVLLRDINFCVGYIDDLLIYSDTWEEHMLHVAVVLDRVGGAGLTFNPAKCSIGKSSVKFLGHILSAEGQRPDPSKTDQVRDAPFPETKKDLHHWVSLLGYYAPYITDFALITAPLQDYIHSKPIKVNGKMQHLPPGEKERAAFEQMRACLLSDLVIIRPDYSQPFILAVDAARKIGGCGAVLLQLRDGQERVIAYWSVRWLDSTANWAPVEHECYAFRRAVERFYEHVTVQRFSVIADSEPLVWLQTLRRPKGRMAEWILELQPLDYTVVHRPGLQHGGPDAFSRLALVPQFMNEDRRRCKLNARSPFEGSEPVEELTKTDEPPAPVVAHVGVIKGGAKWQRRAIKCVITDGQKVLVFPAFNGSIVLPSAAKRFKAEPVFDVAVEALARMMGLCNEAVLTTVQLAVGRPHVVKSLSYAYVVFAIPSVECLSQLTPMHIDSWGRRDNQYAIWASPEAVSLECADLEDRRMMRRLQLVRDLTMSCHPALAAALRGQRAGSQVMSLVPAVMAMALPDGRAIPQLALSKHADVFGALRLIAAYLSAVADTIEDFIFADLEYDMCAYGTDLVQVAVGEHIFVFDTLLFAEVLTLRMLQPPADFQCEPVPTLRYWFERPGTRLVLHASVNDVSKLKQCGIVIESLFDTQLADAVLQQIAEGGHMRSSQRHTRTWGCREQCRSRAAATICWEFT